MTVPISFLIVFLGSYLLSFFAHGTKGVGAAYAAAIRGGSSEECKAAVAVFRGLGTNFILTGILATVIGFVAMANVFGGPNAPAGAASWVMGSAVAILTTLYAIIALLFLVTPFSSAAARAAVGVSGASQK